MSVLLCHPVRPSSESSSTTWNDTHPQEVWPFIGWNLSARPRSSEKVCPFIEGRCQKVCPFVCPFVCPPLRIKLQHLDPRQSARGLAFYSCLSVRSAPALQRNLRTWKWSGQFPRHSAESPKKSGLSSGSLVPVFQQPPWQEGLAVSRIRPGQIATRKGLASYLVVVIAGRSGQECTATSKTKPRRQLELTPNRVVLRDGRV